MGIKMKETLIEDLRVWEVPIGESASSLSVAKHLIRGFFLNRGLTATVLYRINHALAKNWPLLAKLFAVWRSGKYACDISYLAEIGPGFKICHPFDIVIGHEAVIGSHFTVYNGVTIGGKHFNALHLKPKIGTGVTVGSGAKLLGPIIIEDNVTIGAMTFCDKSIPTGATAYGNPMTVKPHQAGDTTS